MGGVEKGAPLLFACGFLGRFTETSFNRLLSQLQLFIGEPLTRANLGDSVGRSRTRYRVSGTRTRRVRGGDREGRSIFSPHSGAALDGRTYPDIRHCPLKTKQNHGVLPQTREAQIIPRICQPLNRSLRRFFTDSKSALLTTGKDRQNCNSLGTGSASEEREPTGVGEAGPRSVRLIHVIRRAPAMAGLDWLIRGGGVGYAP